MHTKRYLCFGWLIVTMISNIIFVTAQDKKKPTIPNTINEDIVSGFKFRSIGPAFMSGRISDIAIHPNKPSTWYITAGSGGVWKTENSGNTWTPIFDNYTSYSIGCVTIDPIVPSTVWVGTGENIGGRHVGFGDGIYRSDDDGKSFVNMGLTKSEHISKIIVHPKNRNIVLVAAQGPLWSQGGERGIFKSIDGGKSWQQTLGDKVWVGATDLAVDPRNPDVMYAATWQRHRTIANYMGGGPGTAIYKSVDGGDNWTKLTSGLPTSNMGKIGLAISPQKPDVLYAAIELDRRSGAVYKSMDGGMTWSKMSDSVSGATGPHYYQELYASPHQYDKLFLMDVRIQVSNDGGKSFSRLKEEYKHSDNHAIAFLPDRPDYLLVGTDGGLYETYDNAENWKYFANLPLTQFYDLAMDDSKPFYKIYGGTQDNATQGGPSRTDNVHGIANSDWKMVLDWDGQQPATEPGNPDIIYGQRQEGFLSRIDIKTGEITDIQPSLPDNTIERFNWDAPIFISPHLPSRVYFASQRLWRSDNRGDSWTAVSGDLTRNQNRFELDIMGGKQSIDNPWDVLAMSNFNTITTIAESPKQENLIYIGTDDGLIQVSENGGQTWQKLEVSQLPGCPAKAYVVDIKADHFDANIAYATLENHKNGDFNAYVYKTTDKGKTWKSIKGDFPDRNFIWRLVQDHSRPELIFAATEFGIYVTFNGGSTWTKMKGGIPTISFRDIQIHPRENDLVAASFGRSFYVLDDITPLRKISDDLVQKEAHLFDVKEALWYVPKPHLSFESGKGDQGAAYYMAPNPPFGANITYYLKEDIKSLKEKRLESEKKAKEANQAPVIPSWTALSKEASESTPKIILYIYDAQGQLVRKISGPAKKGIHRLAWDLRYPSLESITSQATTTNSGFLAAPGNYSVSMFKEVDGVITPIGDQQRFIVSPLYQNSLSQMGQNEVAQFWRRFEKVSANVSRLNILTNNTTKYTKGLRLALQQSSLIGVEESKQIKDAEDQLKILSDMMFGNEIANQVGEKTEPTISARMFDIFRGVAGATYGPTKTNMRIIEDTERLLTKWSGELVKQQEVLQQLAHKILDAGGPFVEKAW